MSNKTRDIEILDGRVSKLLIMLKRYIKTTDEQKLKIQELEARIIALENA